MTELTNPYTPPLSNFSGQIDEQALEVPQPIYTPFQVRLASFLGGPLASVYSLYQNFKQLHDAQGMRLTLVLGLGFCALLFGILPFLPERMPNQILPLAYSFAAGWIASSKQLNKDQIKQSTQYQRRSGWNVTAVTLISLVVSCLIIFPYLFLLSAIGIIRLA